MKRFIVGFLFCFLVFVFGTFLGFRLQDASRPLRTAGFPRAFWAENSQQSRFHRGALAVDLAIALYCSWRFGRYFQRRAAVESSETDALPEPPKPEVQTASAS
jgi:hypothetical protein